MPFDKLAVKLVNWWLVINSDRWLRRDKLAIYDKKRLKKLSTSNSPELGELPKSVTLQ